MGSNPLASTHIRVV